MKYKVTIEELIIGQDVKYPNAMEIYSQIVDDLNVVDVIKAVNMYKKEE